MLFVRSELEKNSIGLFVGILLYTIGKTFLIYYLSRTSCAIIELFGLLVFVRYFIKLPKQKVKIDFDASIAYNIFLFIGIVTALRGLFSFNSIFAMKELVTRPDTFIVYFMPFLFFLRITPELFSSLKKIAVIFLIVGLLFYFLNIQNLYFNATAYFSEIVVSEEDDKFLQIARCNVQFNLLYAIFLFYINKSLHSKVKFFLYISLVTSIVSIALAGRRGGLFTIILYAILPYLYNIKFKYLCIIFFLILLFFYYGIGLIEDNFTVLSNRLFDDTRSWAEKEFYESMNIKDYIIGKGSMGTFYSPYFKTHRNLIETGYLHLILKGGIFYSFAWCYLLISSFIKGYFFSSNKMVKVMSLYIFPFIPGLYLFGHPDFNIQYVVLWICLACCNQPCLRNNEKKNYLE